MPRPRRLTRGAASAVCAQGTYCDLLRLNQREVPAQACTRHGMSERRGRGDGTFLGSLGYAMIYGGPMALADFDGAGRLDVGVAERVDQVVRWHVYRNELCR